MKTADRENVFQICDELNQKGQKPTLERVRQMLGGGSFTTIQPLLREWKDKRTEDPAAGSIAVPEDIHGMLAAMASQVWVKAQAKAGEDLRVLRESMQARLDEAEQEKVDAMLEVSRLEKENTEHKDSRKLLEVELGGYKEALQDARVELAVHSKLAVEGETLTKRHEKLLLEVGELKGRLAAATEYKKSPNR